MKTKKISSMAARYLATLAKTHETSEVEAEFNRVTTCLDIVLDDDFWSEFWDEISANYVPCKSIIVIVLRF